MIVYFSIRFDVIVIDFQGIQDSAEAILITLFRHILLGLCQRLRDLIQNLFGMRNNFHINIVKIFFWTLPCIIKNSTKVRLADWRCSSSNIFCFTLEVEWLRIISKWSAINYIGVYITWTRLGLCHKMWK